MKTSSSQLFGTQFSTTPLMQHGTTLFPGVVVCIIIAVTAHLLSEHYSTPAMLLALLLGIAVSFLGEEGRTVPGISFSAKSLLRFGVALLGVRVSASLIANMPLELILLVMAGVVFTITFGLLTAPFFGKGWRFALLTSGAVAICGASAAMAIVSVLPRDKESEQRLIFTVVGVTMLSTSTMIAYPLIVNALSLDHTAAGIFIGGAIHDVAQVAGAGFTISETTGETALLIKMFRVSMLAPIVLIAALIIKQSTPAQANAERPPLLPFFLIGFIALALINSLGLIPAAVADWLAQLSRWLLIVAIAAVGMKTNLKRILSVGGAAIGLLVVETLFIGAFMLGGILLLY